MPSLDAASDVATIDQLRADEAALDRRLDEARRTAEEQVVAARERAARESADAAGKLAVELRERDEVLRRLIAEIEASAREQAVRRVEEVRARAESARADAVGLLVAAVGGVAP